MRFFTKKLFKNWKELAHTLITENGTYFAVNKIMYKIASNFSKKKRIRDVVCKTNIYNI